MGQRTDTLKIVAAFAAVYVIWGSTYLGILIGLETLPPFLMAGARFLLAGFALYGWLRLRGAPRPSDGQWWAASVTGTLMLVGGVGTVTWAEQWVPSGVAALLVATVPLWMTGIDTVLMQRTRPGWQLLAGLGVGLVGVAVLVSPAAEEIGGMNLLGALAILGASASWSIGSLHSRTASLPRSPAMTAAIQMSTAGVVLLVISSALGEWQSGFALAQVSGRSVAALLYLAVFGSMVTLCAYLWLLRQVSAPAVATYAFVNPMVAVFLGWWLAAEAVDARVVMATVLIVGAVVLIQSASWLRRFAENAADEAARAAVRFGRGAGGRATVPRWNASLVRRRPAARSAADSCAVGRSRNPESAANAAVDMAAGITIRRTRR